MATAKFYGKFFQAAFNKEVDVDTDVFKLMLVNGYTFDQDVHDYKNDITNEVANGNGYTTGGATVSPMSVTYTGATNVLAITGANASWPGSTFTATGAVLYDATGGGTDATRPLVGYVDFGGALSPVNGTLSVTWDPAGIATVTVA